MMGAGVHSCLELDFSGNTVFITDLSGKGLRAMFFYPAKELFYFLKSFY